MYGYYRKTGFDTLLPASRIPADILLSLNCVFDTSRVVRMQACWARNPRKPYSIPICGAPSGLQIC